MIRSAMSPVLYRGASSVLYSSGPMTFPVHIPTNTMADVHFFFVSPAVFWACQA